MMEAELFDGTVLEFPDGTSPEVIQRVVKEQTAAKKASGGAALSQPPAAAPQAPVEAPVEPAAVQQTQAPAPAPQGDSTVMAILKGLDRYAGQYARGLRDGAANIVDLPIQAVNHAPRLANLIPGVDGVGPISRDPFLPGRAVNSLIDKAEDLTSGLTGAPAAPREAQTGAEHFVRRVGEEMGAAAVPTVGLMQAAKNMPIEQIRNGGALSRMFLEPAKIDPNFAIKEATAAAASGTGAATAGALFGDKDSRASPVAELGGSLGGLTIYGLANTGARMAKTIFDAVRQSPKYTDQVVRDTVTGRLAAAMGSEPNAQGVIDTAPLVQRITGEGTDPIVAQIFGTSGQKSVSDTIPGFKESLADRTRDPNLAALEYSRQSGENAGLFAQRRNENTKAIDSAINRSAPDPNATPGQFSSELALERDRRLMDADVAARNAADEAERAVQPLAVGSTPAQRGNTVRTALEDARDTARRETDAAYNSLGIQGRMVDPAPLTEAIDGRIASLTETERGLLPQGLIERVSRLGRSADPAPQPTGVLGPDGNPIMRPPEPPARVDLKEATDLRSELLRLQRAALADPRAEKGGRNAARVIGQLVEDVDGFVARNLSTDEQAALQRARQSKFEEAEAFGRQGDPVYGVLARNEGGIPKVRDDMVAGKFVDPQNMERLFAQADTPQVRSAIREEVLSRGDTSSAQRIRDFMGSYPEQIDRFPGLRDELETAARARETQAGAAESQATLTKDLDRGTVGRYLQFGDERAESAMRGVMASKEPAKAMDELLTFVNNDPKAVEGARKVFWGILQKDTRAAGATTKTTDSVQPFNPARLKAFLDDPAKAAVAERLYRDNPEHLQNIRDVAEAIQGVDVRNSAKAPNSSGTAQGNQSVLTPESLQSRFYAYARGQVGAAYLATSIAATFARGKIRAAQGAAINRLLDEALLNPEVAAGLLKENNPANRAALARKSKTWAASHLSDFITDEDEADTKDAIMRK